MCFSITNLFNITNYKASGLYYKHVTIVKDNSSVVNKWSFKLIDNLRVVIYDRHKFIIQAIGVFLGVGSSLVNKHTRLFQQVTRKNVLKYCFLAGQQDGEAEKKNNFFPKTRHLLTREKALLKLTTTIQNFLNIRAFLFCQMGLYRKTFHGCN